MMKIRQKKTLRALVIGFLGLVFTACSSELAKNRAHDYCKCLQEAKGELTQMNECMSIIDSAKVEFEKTPRHWIKFQKALNDCQN